MKVNTVVSDFIDAAKKAGFKNAKQVYLHKNSSLNSYVETEHNEEAQKEMEKAGYGLHLSRDFTHYYVWTWVVTIHPEKNKKLREMNLVI